MDHFFQLDFWIERLSPDFGQNSLLFSIGILCTTTLIGFCLFHLANRYYRSRRIPCQGRAVLVTGCARGFGHSLAKKLHDMGLIVFACCLNPLSDGAMTLKKLGKESGRMHVIGMDVSNQKDVDEARRYIQDHLPKEGLWGVVNNAGFARTGYLEWVPMEDFEKVLSTNLYGTIRVTKAFLPLIRQSRGRIVNVSSVLSDCPEVFNGPYSISKCGIDMFTDVLRLEMRQFNVKVVGIRPGNFIGATNIISTENDFETLVKKLWERMDDSLRQDYGIESCEKYIRFVDALRKFSAKNDDQVIDSLIDALTCSYPESVYVPASVIDIVLAALFRKYCPSFLSNSLREFIYYLSFYI